MVGQIQKKLKSSGEKEISKSRKLIKLSKKLFNSNLILVR